MPGTTTVRRDDARDPSVRRAVLLLVVLTLSLPATGVAVGGGSAGAAVGDAAARPDRVVDVVFVFDRSGSMDENRYELAREMAAIDERLDAAGADARYALLTYAGSVRTEQGWTGDYADVDRALDFRTAGSTENASDAVLAATSMGFRDGADRVVVLVTDEDDDSPAARRDDAVASLSGFRFVSVSPSAPGASSCAIHSPPCDDDPANELRSVARDAGGTWVDASDDAEAIVGEAGAVIAPASSRPAPPGDDDDGAEVAVRNATISPGTVEIGEPVEVAVTVENTGGEPGRFDANLASGFESLASRSVDVPAGETRTVTFVTAFREPARYDLYVSHAHVGRVEVTPLRPTVVRTALRGDGRALLANVSDARANETVTVPLSDLDVAADGSGLPANLTLTPARAADFQLRIAARRPNGTAPLPDGVRPVAYLVVETDLDDGDVAGVTVEYRTLPEEAAVYRYAGNGTAWERLEATAAGDAAGGPRTARTGWSSAFAIGVRGPVFEVTDVEVDRRPVVGEAVRTTVTVDNAGPVGGAYRAEVRLDGREVAVATTSVPAGGTRRVALTFTPMVAGTYRVVTGDGAGRTIRVGPQPTRTPSPTPTPTSTATPGQAGFGLAAAIAAMVVLWLLARTRR